MLGRSSRGSVPGLGAPWGGGGVQGVCVRRCLHSGECCRAPRGTLRYRVAAARTVPAAHCGTIGQRPASSEYQGPIQWDCVVRWQTTPCLRSNAPTASRQRCVHHTVLMPGTASGLAQRQAIEVQAMKPDGLGLSRSLVSNPSPQIILSHARTDALMHSPLHALACLDMLDSHTQAHRYCNKRRDMAMSASRLRTGSRTTNSSSANSSKYKYCSLSCTKTARIPVDACLYTVSVLAPSGQQACLAPYRDPDPQVKYSMRKYALVVPDFCPCIITNRATGLHPKSLHSAKCAGRYRQVAWRAAWKPSHSAFVPTAQREMPNLLAWAQMG